MLVTCELYGGKSITKCSRLVRLGVQKSQKLIPMCLLCGKTSTVSGSRGAWEPRWTERESGMKGGGRWNLNHWPISENFANRKQS